MTSFISLGLWRRRVHWFKISNNPTRREAMKIVVFGPTGGTGRLFMQKTLQAGHFCICAERSNAVAKSSDLQLTTNQSVRWERPRESDVADGSPDRFRHLAMERTRNRFLTRLSHRLHIPVQGHRILSEPNGWRRGSQKSAIWRLKHGIEDTHVSICGALT